MKSFPLVITDPVYKEPDNFNFYQRFWLKRIYDKRDLPFIHLLTITHLLVIPTAVLLYTPLIKSSWAWWMVAEVYFYFSQFYLKGSFGLMLHCICHRKLFRVHTKIFYRYINWFVCPFFGHLGDSYHIHHMGMHHLENNMPEDSSSTMMYKRDSFFDFVKYWLRFMFFGFHDTFMYLFNRKRKKMYRRLTVSEIGFIVIVTALCFLNWKATLVVFIVPFLFARLVMMMGNWTQHAFVDPDEPDNELASTIICINSVYNHKCWNDGYHAIHHVRPGAHYTEIPLIFEQMLPKLVQHKTLIFERIHYLHIFCYLMTKRYDKLAKNIVNINNTFADDQQVISLLKTRTRKFEMEELKTFSKLKVQLN